MKIPIGERNCCTGHYFNINGYIIYAAFVHAPGAYNIKWTKQYSSVGQFSVIL